jgi:dTDP-L-rhamnose 4-epimerase
MDHPQSDGQVINIGSGTPITIRRVAEMLAQSLSMNLEPIISNKYRAGDVRHCYADISRARAMLGYSPRITHQEGFQELAEWLRGQQAEDRADTMLKELSAYGLTS